MKETVLGVYFPLKADSEAASLPSALYTYWVRASQFRNLEIKEVDS